MIPKTQNSLALATAPGTILDPLPPPAGDGPAAETPTPELDPRRTYVCSACRHVLRVTGLGRHRVYFELSDERLENPVMDRVCPACRQTLPGKSTG